MLHSTHLATAVLLFISLSFFILSHDYNRRVHHSGLSLQGTANATLGVSRLVFSPCTISEFNHSLRSSSSFLRPHLGEQKVFYRPQTARASISRSSSNRNGPKNSSRWTVPLSNPGSLISTTSSRPPYSPLPLFWKMMLTGMWKSILRVTTSPRLSAS